jgi:hypothetical protein
VIGCSTDQALSCRFSITESRVNFRVVRVEFVLDPLAVRQVFFEQFTFALQVIVSLHTFSNEA